MLVKIAIYTGFCVYRRSYLIGSPVTVIDMSFKRGLSRFSDDVAERSIGPKPEARKPNRTENSLTVALLRPPPSNRAAENTAVEERAYHPSALGGEGAEVLFRGGTCCS